MKNIRNSIEDGKFPNGQIDTTKLPFKSVEEIINDTMPYGGVCKENDNQIYDDLIR